MSLGILQANLCIVDKTSRLAIRVHFLHSGRNALRYNRLKTVRRYRIVPPSTAQPLLSQTSLDHCSRAH